MRTRMLAGVVALVAGGAVAPAAMATGWDEGVDGDLSGDRLNPTVLGALGIGVHSVTATSVAGDLEYLTLTVPAGLSLGSVVLSSYSGPSQSFGAVQQGAVFTEDAGAPDVGNLFGWTHFGPAAGNDGTDILDDMGVGAGAIGFVPPLGPGDYTLWLQETGPNAVTYTLDFAIIPVPGSAVLTCGLATALMARRRR